MKNYYKKRELLYDFPEFEKMYDELSMEIHPDQAMNITDDFMNQHYEDAGNISFGKITCHSVLEKVLTVRSGWSHYTEFTGEPSYKEEQVHVAYIFMRYSITSNGIIETFEVRGSIDLDDGISISETSSVLWEKRVRVSVIPLSERAKIVSQEYEPQDSREIA